MAFSRAYIVILLLVVLALVVVKLHRNERFTFPTGWLKDKKFQWVSEPKWAKDLANQAPVANVKLAGLLSTPAAPVLVAIDNRASVRDQGNNLVAKAFRLVVGPTGTPPTATAKMGKVDADTYAETANQVWTITKVGAQNAYYIRTGAGSFLTYSGGDCSKFSLAATAPAPTEGWYITPVKNADVFQIHTKACTAGKMFLAVDDKNKLVLVKDGKTDAWNQTFLRAHWDLEKIAKIVA